MRMSGSGHTFHSTGFIIFVNFAKTRFGILCSGDKSHHPFSRRLSPKPPCGAGKRKAFSQRRRLCLSKNLVEFRRRSGERKSDHFLRRHVRRGKYFSACKRTHCPPKADSACAAVRPKTPLSKKYYFFDSLKPSPNGEGFAYLQDSAPRAQ